MLINTSRLDVNYPGLITSPNMELNLLYNTKVYSKADCEIYNNVYFDLNDFNWDVRDRLYIC